MVGRKFFWYVFSTYLRMRQVLPTLELPIRISLISASYVSTSARDETILFRTAIPLSAHQLRLCLNILEYILQI